VVTASPTQPTLDTLGTPLREVDFVVVDLETTGGSPAGGAEITEIGAVRVRAGEVQGELATLVRPRASIPAFIAVLTGITDAMVAGAPGVAGVLPTFLEFARGSVLVAHNAPFDLGFLRAAAADLGLEWPAFPVLDTARLARRVLTRDEAPDCRLATLARLFRTASTPNHRALADARATVEVLHGLLERVGSLGVQTWEELSGYSSAVPQRVRRKRYLAESLPHAPGVYLFRDARGEVLYVGKSRDLRTRVSSYFTAAEGRRRMAEMVGLAARVDHVECAHALEAEVRELRLIAEHVPRYNRRSRFPSRSVYLRLTDEPFPRLSVVRGLRESAPHLGPYSSVRTAEDARSALLVSVPLRQCRSRLPARVTRPGTPCVLAEMARCGAPCDGRQDREAYAAHASAAAAAMAGDPRPVVKAGMARIEALTAEQRFEEAARARDRVAAFVRGAARRQRLSALTGVAQLVAARPSAAVGGQSGWEVAVVRQGRLAGSGVTTPGVPVRQSVEAIVATAETVLAGVTAAASPEESECILRWLAGPGVRLVELDGCWASPAWGAGGLSRWLAGPPGTDQTERSAGRPRGSR
jgi:DNA polymerase-3 subunit epsilon